MKASVILIKSSVVINTAGLHVGGGVQVATSFIDELSGSDINDLSVSVLISSEVHRNLLELKTDASVFDQYHVFDVYGIKAFFQELPNIFVMPIWFSLSLDQLITRFLPELKLLVSPSLGFYIPTMTSTHY
ncbi:MAG: hypothetical protein IPJ50_01960 [Betaproteobacteria bacterium]|nr:hypothetical protein [Betaproteobacteria bacterium]